MCTSRGVAAAAIVLATACTSSETVLLADAGSARDGAATDASADAGDANDTSSEAAPNTGDGAGEAQVPSCVGAAGEDAGTICATASCVDDNWAQWPMPNSAAEVGQGAPNLASYTLHGDGTVIDDVTGLTWQQTPPASPYVFADAASYCTSLRRPRALIWGTPSATSKNRPGSGCIPVADSSTVSLVLTEDSNTDFTMRDACASCAVRHGTCGNLPIDAAAPSQAVQTARLLQAAVPISATFAVPFFIRPDPEEDDFDLGHRSTSSFHDALTRRAGRPPASNRRRPLSSRCDTGRSWPSLTLRTRHHSISRARDLQPPSQRPRRPHCPDATARPPLGRPGRPSSSRKPRWRERSGCRACIAHGPCSTPTTTSGAWLEGLPGIAPPPPGARARPRRCRRRSPFRFRRPRSRVHEGRRAGRGARRGSRRSPPVRRVRPQESPSAAGRSRRLLGGTRREMRQGRRRGSSWQWCESPRLTRGTVATPTGIEPVLPT